jgi:hypothetical protein
MSALLRITMPLIAALLGALAASADTITLDESKRAWPQSFSFVSGELVICTGAPSSIFGPCGSPGASDVIVFDNAKGEIFFLSNLNDSDVIPEPADVPFGGSIQVFNPRFVQEPFPVGGLSTFVWSPGPTDPGFHGFGNTWTISSDAPETVPEPSSIFLLGACLLIGAAARRSLSRNVRDPR